MCVMCACVHCVLAYLAVAIVLRQQLAINSWLGQQEQHFCWFHLLSDFDIYSRCYLLPFVRRSSGKVVTAYQQQRWTLQEHQQC